jgi:4'-phosphopantetheinyl transferase EntD
MSDHTFPLYPGEEQSVLKAVAKRRIEFSAGRHCARVAMGRLGYPPCALPSGADRVPVWPASLTGSITHNDEFCAAVVASRGQYRSIGIDMEAIDSVSVDLVEEVFHPCEIVELDLHNRPDGADWPTLHFCLKEAAFKAFYPIFGKIINFQEMRIWANPPNRTFFAQAFIEAGSIRPTFQGRYLVSNGRIHAACW